MDGNGMATGELTDAEVFGADHPLVYGAGSAVSGQPVTPAQATYARQAQGVRDASAPAGTVANPSYDTPDLTGSPGSYHVTPQGGLSDPHPQVEMGLPRAGEMSDADVFGHMAPNASHEDDGRPVSQPLGFGVGVHTVANNLTNILSGNIPGMPQDGLGVSPLSLAARLIMGHQQGVIDRASQTERPGQIGKFLGEVAATAPLAVDAVGPLALGAFQGALTSEGKDPLSKIVDVGAGAIGGKLADLGLGAVKSAVAPVLRPAAQWAADHGIGLTPGQSSGGVLKALEGIVSKFPISGIMVRSAQNRTVDDFGRSTYNGLLSHAGLPEIPSTVAPGNATNAAAHKAFASAYEKILPPLTLTRDEAFNEGLPDLVSNAVSLGQSHGPGYAALLKEGVDKLGPDGTMNGRVFKDFDTKLGQEARAASKDPALMSQKYAAAVQDLQSHFRDLLERSNPTEAPQLTALNRGYAGLVTADKAATATATNEGRFTPDDLIRAGRTTDYSNRKTSTAAGEAMLQDWANQAKANGVPNKFHAGGDIPGALMEGLVTLGVGKESGLLHGVVPMAATDALLAGLYTKPAQRVINGVITRTPGPRARAVADIIRELQPVGGYLAGTAAPKLLPDLSQVTPAATIRQASP